MKQQHLYLTRCPKCGGRTTKVYVRLHGECKSCRVPPSPSENSPASDREARIIDHGWDAYATEEGHDG